MGRVAVVQTTSSKESRKRLEAFAAGKPYLRSGQRPRGRENRRRDRRGDEHWRRLRSHVSMGRRRAPVQRSALRGVEHRRPRLRDRSLRPAGCGAAADDVPAKLAKLLLARHRAGAGPITLFPCELTPANGNALRAAVLGVLDRWEAPTKARRWIEAECVWVNSLVDRIVSEPLKPVGAVAEPYALWAIEDQPGLELPCRHASITVTGDLKPFERLKLFILNLGHTYLAEIWAREGCAPMLTVREAIVADNAIRAELDQLFDEEVLPVFAGIGMKEQAEAYRATVVERLCNPFLDHRLAEIFTNHEAKKQRRFGGLIELAKTNDVQVKLPRLRAALASELGDRVPHTG